MKRSGVVLFLFCLGLSLQLLGCDFLGLGKSKNSGGSKVDRRDQQAKPPELTYVGRETCGKCHEEEVQGYARSAHDRATELAQGQAVEAPFQGEKLAEKNQQATFLRKDGLPVISTEADYPVKWTIGFSPLQQYIFAGERGRFLAFAGAFDTRNKGDGGQRWYFPSGSDAKEEDSAHHIREDKGIWNAQCAHCHSTAVEKNYDFETDTYDTKFQELDVSCEACHGPASRHVALAAQFATSEKWPDDGENAGFDRALSTYARRRWVRGPEEKVAKLAGDGEAPPEKTDELLTCAPCHSASTDLGPSNNKKPLSDFSDRYALQVLEEEFFFPDGQAKSSGYTYNSFVQTKMQHAGVVCSDCHNPHAGTLRSPAVDLCVSCHDPDTYSQKEHTLHEQGQEVTCVDCHMPEKSFLGTGTRRDHGFPIPRPDLTLSIDVPSSCETCHAHRPKWAATIIEERMGTARPGTTATAFHAASVGAEDAPKMLGELFSNKGIPQIVRASALKRWAELGRSTPQLAEAIRAGTKDESALVRRVAAEFTPSLAEESRMSALAPLFDDKMRTVRVAAAVASLEAAIPEKPNAALEKALMEAKVAHSFRSDRADGLLTLAALEARLGGSGAMDHLYELACARHPEDPRTFASFATALKRAGKIDRAQEVVLQGLKLHSKDPALLFARGRHLVQQGKAREALPYLQTAFEGAPRSLRRESGYTLAVTIHKLGDWAEALAILRLLKSEYPEAAEVQDALTIYEEKRSKRE